MSDDLHAIAEGMHNYYRRLVATGWQPVKDGYAPTAKAMLGVKYGCGDPNDPANIGAATKALIDDCPKDKPKATGVFSLNYYHNQTLLPSREELLEMRLLSYFLSAKAITKWANEASAVGKDNVYKKGEGFDNYANMMHDKVTQVTCAVNICTRTGQSAVVCQYDVKVDFSKQYICGFLVYGLKSGESATVSSRRINAVFGNGTVVERPTQDWSRRFRDGDFNRNVFSCSGRASAVGSIRLRQLVDSDPRQTMCGRTQVLVFVKEHKS
ncbi:hypothetical protein Y032_0522g2883 [Ancylostoma ceylanicum]|uniref:SCP domain-containing protein n=1 Tax=Ancylostoma ceylanicum TaxID=53326 RepID=A0A016WUF4_9BILA|nr:hypothetical protein Y032_0522g2883 [Ancylostoma ceylanicum]